MCAGICECAQVSQKRNFCENLRNSVSKVTIYYCLSHATGVARKNKVFRVPENAKHFLCKRGVEGDIAITSGY